MDKLPKRGGINLRPEHYQSLLESRPDIGWLSLAPEDYLGAGGEAHYYLQELAALYPLAFNSARLSVGSAESVNAEHLAAVNGLVKRYTPAQFSEQLAWSRWQHTCFDTALPIPYNDETLGQVCINIKTIQTALGRRIQLVNPAACLLFNQQEHSEAEFFQALVRNTGCGMVLDICNLYVSCLNKGLDPFKELNEYPLAAVKEIHISGHTLMPLDDNNILLLAQQNCEPTKPLWQLYREALLLMPQQPPTLVDWRQQLPELETLVGLAQKVDGMMESVKLSPARRTV